MFRYFKFSETQKGYTKNFFGTVEKTFDGKFDTPQPLLCKTISLTQSLSETKKGSPTKIQYF